MIMDNNELEAACCEEDLDAVIELINANDYSNDTYLKILVKCCDTVSNNQIFECILDKCYIPTRSVLTYAMHFSHNTEICTKIINMYKDPIREHMETIIAPISEPIVLNLLLDFYKEEENVFTIIITQMFNTLHILYDENELEKICTDYPDHVISINKAFQALLNKKPFPFCKIIGILTFLLNNEIIVDISTNDHMLFAKICDTCNIELINLICAYYGNVYDTVMHDLIVIPIIKTNKRKRDIESMCDSCCDDSTICTKCYHTICPRCVSALEVYQCPTCREPITYFHTI